MAYNSMNSTNIYRSFCSFYDVALGRPRTRDCRAPPGSPSAHGPHTFRYKKPVMKFKMAPNLKDKSEAQFVKYHKCSVYFMFKYTYIGCICISNLKYHKLKTEKKRELAMYSYTLQF